MNPKTVTRPAWFHQTRSFAGRWESRLTYGPRPAAKTAEGRTLTFRTDPVMVHPGLCHMPLDQLARIYAPDGDLRRIDPATLAHFLADPTATTLTLPLPP